MQKLSQAEEEESEEQETENNEDGNVCLESGHKEYESEEAPQNQEDAQCKAVSAVVALVCVLDTQIRNEEHGECKPEGTIGTMDGSTKGITDAELHKAGKKLGNATEEDSQTKDGLVRADTAEGV